MSQFYDFYLLLDNSGKIQKLHWSGTECRERHEASWQSCIGRDWDSLAGSQNSRESGILSWKGIDFRWKREDFGSHSLCFLKKRFDREVYLEQALNLLNEGVQIYDENGNIVYFDAASKEMLDMDDVERRPLLDVYDLTEEESTVLTVLRTRSPVLNRYAHYFSNSGRELTTVNNARPIILDGSLLGVVNVEENIDLIQKRAARARDTQEAMREQLAQPRHKDSPSHYTLRDLVGEHPKMLQLKTLAKRVADQDNNVMIVGETGTGKEILAQGIHYASRRRKMPFIALNCAAVPETLIESILFGTVKGSFTGSVERPGLFEEANGGTLFLDELNSMSFTMQSKVLRALQEGTFRPVGGSKDIHVDVRVLSSCNEDTARLVEQQKLRSDLFYRLATIVLEIPPLRERTEDIEPLVRLRISQNRDKYVFPFTQIDETTLAKLRCYRWPGNVRELFHVVDYAMNIADDTVFRPQYLPRYCSADAGTEQPSPERRPEAGTGTLQEQVAVFEAAVIEDTLRTCRGNISQAARMLGLQRQGLQYRVRKYGIWTE